MRILKIKLILATLLISSCATRMDVSNDYKQKISQTTAVHRSEKTAVLFLVDGLSYSVLEKQLQKNNLPHLQSYFNLKKSKPLKVFSSFPSLTYTNISGLLKERPVHQTGSIGNKFFFENQLIDFESLRDRSQFSRHMRADNVFTRLQQKNQQSLSLDYGLGVDATFSADFDLQSAYSASQLDYTYADRKKIEALEILLSQAKPQQWPEFVFIHLVGLDLVSHRFGPGSSEALFQLQTIDRDLGRVFSKLKAEEKNHRIVSMLTADHGFAPSTKINIHLENILKKINPNTILLNESRMAGVYFQSGPSEAELIDMTRQFLKNKNIEIVSFKNEKRIRIVSRKAEYYFDFVPNHLCEAGFLSISVNRQAAVCTNQLPAAIDNAFYPYFIQNLASYFYTTHSPDLVVIPQSHAVFKGQEEQQGYHGGPTPEETIVPLLLRNAIVKDANEIHPLWQTLHFIN